MPEQLVVGKGLRGYRAWDEVLTWLSRGWHVPRLRAEVSPITKFALTGEVGSLLLAPPVILTGVP